MPEQDNDAPEVNEQTASNRLSWFLVGLVIGAAASVLYAPKSGRDTREFITRKTSEGREAVESAGGNIIDRGRDLYDKGRQLVDDAAELFERGRKLVRG
jgi:gas vesicle protein